MRKLTIAAALFVTSFALPATAQLVQPSPSPLPTTPYGSALYNDAQQVKAALPASCSSVSLLTIENYVSLYFGGAAVIPSPLSPAQISAIVARIRSGVGC